MKRLINKIGKTFLLGSIIFTLQTKQTANFSNLSVKDPRKVIVLDAAHGRGNKEELGEWEMDWGDAVYGEYKEANIVLEIVKMTKQMLDPSKYKVILTRENNLMPTPLEYRTRLADSLGADRFFSIHINNLWDPTVKGFEIYYRYDDSENLAYLGRENFQEHTLIPASKRGGGVIKENYKVLKGLDCPAILFEVLYISNEEDREKILNNLPGIAKALVKTIEDSYKKDSI